MITIKLLYLFFWGFTNSYAQNECIVERTQLPGQCKLIEECPAVIEDFTKKRPYTNCRFAGRQQLVCCPIENKNRVRGRVFTRLHERKCHEYQSAIYRTVYSMGLAIGAERKENKIAECHHDFVPLIVGGGPAAPKEFPHMALLGYEPEKGEISWECGGTLISIRFVITAAHCMNTKAFGEPKYVQLGALDLKNPDNNAVQMFGVKRSFKHPDYKIHSKYNDLGLLLLDKDVKINSFIRPACLPTSFESIDRKVIATGWGRTEDGGLKSDILKTVTLDKFLYDDCNKIYSGASIKGLPNGIQNQSHICAGSKVESLDTCQGDSGGPLQVYHREEECMYMLVGVTSFGVICGDIGTPGIYTRVYNYIDWIEETIWPNQKL